MPSISTIVVVSILILFGSSLLFFVLFGFGTINLKRTDKLEKVRKKYTTLLLTAGVILILGAFSIIIFPLKHPGNNWTEVQKEEMINKIMESSIFVHGIGADTARLISECFINKYTSLYSPQQMIEQNKMSNADISKLTRLIMVECLGKYGLPMIDTAALR